jgi:hypothetical protein
MNHFNKYNKVFLLQQSVTTCISSVLLVEETGEIHPPATSHWLTLSHNVYIAWEGFELTTLVVIGIDCIGSYKSNYYAITTTTAPVNFMHSDLMNEFWGKQTMKINH